MHRDEFSDNIAVCCAATVVGELSVIQSNQPENCYTHGLNGNGIEGATLLWSIAFKAIPEMGPNGPEPPLRPAHSQPQQQMRAALFRP